MRRSNKEHLYKAAFKLFLIKQFEGVAISDIEKESGMTRGAVFYYVNSKKELFREVLEYFIVNKQNIDNKISIKENASLLQFIDAYVEGIQNVMKSMQEIIDELSPYNASRAYVSMVLQIATYFPDLHEQYVTNRNNELGLWISIVQKAIEEGEIRKDIDVLNTARHFICLFYGQSFLDSLSFGLNISSLKEQMYNLYKLLKISD